MLSQTQTSGNLRNGLAGSAMMKPQMQNRNPIKPLWRSEAKCHDGYALKREHASQACDKELPTPWYEKEENFKNSATDNFKAWLAGSFCSYR